MTMTIIIIIIISIVIIMKNSIFRTFIFLPVRFVFKVVDHKMIFLKPKACTEAVKEVL